MKKQTEKLNIRGVMALLGIGHTRAKRILANLTPNADGKYDRAAVVEAAARDAQQHKSAGADLREQALVKKVALLTEQIEVARLEKEKRALELERLRATPTGRLIEGRVLREMLDNYLIRLHGALRAATMAMVPHMAGKSAPEIHEVIEGYAAAAIHQASESVKRWTHESEGMAGLWPDGMTPDPAPAPVWAKPAE